MVKHTLKAVANVLEMPYQQTHHAFIRGDNLFITETFWEIFWISKSYGVSEGYAYKLIRWVEDPLIKSKSYSLPGRKALLKSDVEYEVILIDASETPIQRPKKSNASTTQGKRNDIL